MVKKVETLTELEGLIKNHNNLVVVDFYADWCGPCRQIAPAIEQMEKEFDAVLFVKVNVDENGEAAEKYEVSAMPTFLLFKGGVKVGSVIGASADRVKGEIQKNL